MTMTGHAPAAPSTPTSCKARSGKKQVREEAGVAAVEAAETVKVEDRDTTSSPAEERSLEARAPNFKPVHETETVTGTANDGLYTWQLKTCVGITAFDPSTGAKAMAHITAWDSKTNQDYKAQVATFRARALAATGSGRQVVVALAPLGSAGAHLHDALTEMNNHIKDEARRLDSRTTSLVRDVVADGSEMGITADGMVIVDKKCYN